MSFPYRPMLARTARTEELGHLLNSHTHAAEAKIDGWRLLAGNLEGENVLFAGRNAAEYTGRLPLIEAALDGLPDDTILDGEIVHRDGIEALGSAMRTHRPHMADDLQYVVFDVLRCEGVDWTSDSWLTRRHILEALAEDLPAPRVRASLLVPVTVAGLEAVLDAGFEGLVVKDRSSRYIQRRSPAWAKIKPQQTCDARVVGCEPGEGSFTGLVGALEFELVGGPHDGVRSTCSGMKMGLREQMSARDEKGNVVLADEWKGALIEIKHHGLNRKSGVPRHPQFRVRRYDLEDAA